jgi:hypothetical protein
LLRSNIRHVAFAAYRRGKREACEITFMDFDDVNFRIAVDPATLNLVEVHVNIKNINELKK